MFEVLKKFYSGKKVFLTGHTGFKGSWLLKILTLAGAEVRGYALAPESENDLFNLIHGSTICTSVLGDLRDRSLLLNTIKEFEPDLVFHLAAQPLVRLSYQMPAETFEVNAIGTANVLDGILQLKNKCSNIFITTDKVYKNNEWEYPYRETDVLGGYDPYSASKACAELVIDSYRNSFFNLSKYHEHKKAIAVGRAGNVIGGGDWAKDRLIPDIVRFLANNKKIEIRNPAAVRPWQHVLEPLLGYLLLGIKITEDPIRYSQAYNFGPFFTDALPVIDMVELFINKWEHGAYFINQTENQVHEAGLLKLDISKAIAELAWKPRFNALKAIENTVDWYKQFFNNKEAIIDFTEDQIKYFLA